MFGKKKAPTSPTPSPTEAPQTSATTEATVGPSVSNDTMKSSMAPEVETSDSPLLDSVEAESAPSKPRQKLSGFARGFHKLFNTSTWQQEQAADAEEKAQREKLIDDQLSALKGSVKLSEYREETFQALQTVNCGDMVAFLEAYNTAFNPRDLYNEFIAPGAPQLLNLEAKVTATMRAQAQTNDYDDMDFQKVHALVFFDAGQNAVITDIPSARAKMAAKLGLPPE